MKSLPPRKNRRVLVVDDNPSIHDDFRKILAPVETVRAAMSLTETQLFGDVMNKERLVRYEVDSANQGQDGVALVKTSLEQGRPYAMAFVDVQMPPGWDGVKTTREICLIDSEIQIVICTAYTDYSAQELFEIVGGNHRLVILKKPFEAAEALQLANELADKWHLKRAVENKQPPSST
jgi:CheY-like chemotaxis protein